MLNFFIGWLLIVNPVGYINGQAIERQEVYREGERFKAKVMNFYVQKYGLTDLMNFWSKDYEGNRPLETLTKEVIKQLVVLKVQEQLLRQHKLWPYPNYKALLEDMVQVNEIRVKMADQGKVIYGPVVFTERTFFDYQFGNAINKLKARLKKSEFVITDEKLTTHFQELKKTILINNTEDFENLKSRVEASYVDREYQKMLQMKVDQAKCQIDEELLSSLFF